eukprot:TRINITY_DN76974_c0_g1_i1.p1 TRINITY_DN76974_c0_g1~~TRINITY_DN76974_c0_g1_i1.p1  ORF type:complete len:226 (+),score=23.31 TRINITY_DN76974_c0_g1_i1:56-679(+)
MGKLADGRRKVLVLFYATWDRFSKAMVPEFARAARLLASHRSLLLAKVDADKYWKLAARYDATAYPHLIIFNKGDKLGVTYDGERTAEAIVDYLLKGKRKGARVPALLPAVQAFTALSDTEGDRAGRARVLAQAEEAVAGLEEGAQGDGHYYLTTMKRIMADGMPFLTKEVEELEGSLSGGGLPPKTYSKVRRQVDILKEFRKKGKL